MNDTLYSAAEKMHWQGRMSNPDIEKQYWHQEIKIIDLNNINNLQDTDVAIIGYSCDEGVRRNRGRIGSNEGPQAIKNRLAKLPIHFENTNISDVGEITCMNDDMEASQQLFADKISFLLKQNVFPIAVGGGHDMAYGHFMGIWKTIKDSPKNRIGIINFDAHFDLRPVEDKPNSGTPFNQILSETKESTSYFAIGIQQQSNTKELFNIAKQDNISFVLNYDCESSGDEFKSLKEKLDIFIGNCDHIYVTVDMDGFSSAYAPGVSAPSPLGFTPFFVFKTLDHILKSKKVISFDIAEVNPSLDRDNVTSNLAAKIIDYVVMSIKN